MKHGGQPTERTEQQTAGQMRPWDVAELPAPPDWRFDPRRMIGPGLMMAGAAIGGGEWLMGPAVTARYGGTIMWVATISILLQAVYNLEVMRYALYCGEPIFVGFFRTLPGPRFWTVAYILLDFGGIWPYLSANAAVPLMAAALGHLPGELPTKYQTEAEVVARTGVSAAVVAQMAEYPEWFLPIEQVAKELEKTAPELRRMADEPEKYLDVAGPKPIPTVIGELLARERRQIRIAAFAIFLLAFVPLIFGGKIYNALEKVMVAKIFLVLGYLTFLGIFFVEWRTWAEIFLGFVQFGQLPVIDGKALTWGQLFASAFGDEKPPMDLALLASFAAIAGTGGLTNTNFSSYAREKGWGMGSLVGAIPSAVGGKGIALAHNGKVFRINPESMRRWFGWRAVTIRDQFCIWVIGCILGMGIPSLVSLQFVRGQNVQGDALAAVTAQRLVDATGIGVFWLMTLFCGFLVLAPSQVSTIDGLVRRWTDVIWTGSRRLERLEGEKVAYVYYGMLVAYALWGLFVLVVIPSPLVIVKVSTGVLLNFALGASAIHTLAVNTILLPRKLRPNVFWRLGLVACAVFFIGIAALALQQSLRDLRNL